MLTATESSNYMRIAKAPRVGGICLSAAWASVVSLR